VEGAIQAGVAYGLFEAIVLNGALAEWIFRGANGITDALRVSPGWRFILFGLGTIQFARHPEGLVENGKRQAARRTEALVARWQRRHDGGGDGPEAGLEPTPAGVSS
jgi:hypothetical protein